MSELSLENQQELLTLVRTVLEDEIVKSDSQRYPTDNEAFKGHQGAFVTLHLKGQLRGCIGRIVSDKPLYDLVQEMAIASALHDSRFKPVTTEEVAELELEISVLTEPENVRSVDEIVVGEHGLIIQQGTRSGLLLPQVPVEHGWDKQTYLKHLCRKAGLPETAFPGSKLYKFSAQVFSERDFGA